MPWNVPGGSGGKKDPWGQGGRGDQGPPDLDEIVRRIQEKLGGLFGGGGRRGSGGAGGTRGVSAGIVVLVVLAIWLASGFYVVQQGERGVVLQFGKKSEVTQAGLRWHLPYPVESVEKVNVERVSVIEIGYRSNARGDSRTKVPREALMLTQDENIVDLEFAVQYRVKDPAAFLFNVRNVEATIVQATESAVREAAGKNSMDFILTEGRAEVGQRTQLLLQEILDRYDSGIFISNLEMQGAQPPEQVKAAFADAVKAREDQERFKNEAQAYSNDIIPRARGGAARMIQQSEGYKASVTARAEGDAHRFGQIVREYAKAPQVTRDRMYIEAMEEVFKNTTKVLIDQKGGNNLIYLPLDKLMEKAATRTGAAATVPAEPVEQASESGVRDRLRGRLPVRGE